MENAIAKIDTGFDIQYFSNTIQVAPTVLEQNKASLTKAKEVAETLIANSERVGMSDALDEQMKVFVDKGKKTLSALNERRKPFTQLIDVLKKEFTSIESDLSKSVDSVVVVRDAYATEKAKKAAEAAKKAAAELAMSQERIEFKKRVEIDLSDKFSKYLAECKTFVLEKFNAATLETLPGLRSYLTNLTGVISVEKFTQQVSSNIQASSMLLNKFETTAILESVIEIKRGNMIEIFRLEMVQYGREILDMLGSKEAQLHEIAKAQKEADANKLIELERRQKEIEQAKQNEIAAQSTQIAQEGARNAEVETSAAITEAIIDAQANLFNQSTDGIKDSYKIRIKNKGAYIQIAQFWFINEGSMWDNDRIEKMTFKRMVEFAEKMALKGDVRIDSEHIEYEAVYKSK